MPATFTPYLTGDAPAIPPEGVAYVPVRITGAPRADGSVLAYLPDGTAFVVNGRHLLRLGPEQDAAG